MKRILLALMIFGWLLPLAPRAQADPEVSLDFFYDNLAPYGSWIDVADYGYCFQPSVAVDNPDWRPYADGYWAYTDAGWTWVSYEDFGWATYHYGRWVDLDDYGWVWVPGYEWGPAWVSWRTGGDYVGWAPLPPQTGVVYEGQPITGAVDVSFGIGPLYYNFVDIRYIGEPVLRGRIIEPRRNVTIINQTVNVTNITYNKTTVINHGPNLERVNRFSTRPIQRLKLQRQTDFSGNFADHRGNLNRVNGNALIVAAPAVQRSPQTLAPKQVKTRIEKPKVERGWQGVSNREQLQAQMKGENAKIVPPPSFKPRNPGPQKSDVRQKPQLKLNEANGSANQPQQQQGRLKNQPIANASAVAGDVSSAATNDSPGVATKVEPKGQRKIPAARPAGPVGRRPATGPNADLPDNARPPQEATRAIRPRPTAPAQVAQPPRRQQPVQPAQPRTVQPRQEQPEVQPGGQQKKNKKPEEQPPGQ